MWCEKTRTHYNISRPGRGGGHTTPMPNVPSSRLNTSLKIVIRPDTGNRALNNGTDQYRPS